MVGEGFLEDLRELKKELEKGCMITMNGEKKVYFMSEKAGELFEKVNKVLEEEEQEEQKEKKKTKTIWDLEEGDEYYFINYQNVVTKSVWHEYPSNKAIRNGGNAFLTREEAGIESQKRAIETLLQKHGGVPFRKLSHSEYLPNTYVLLLGENEDEKPFIGVECIENGLILENTIPFGFNSMHEAKIARVVIGEKVLIAYACGELYEDDED
jgi:hypothetical protein